jgi:hypothetical protein
MNDTAHARSQRLDAPRSYTHPGEDVTEEFSKPARPGARLCAAEMDLDARITDGASVGTEVIEDPLPVPLGEYHYENVGPVRNDTRIDLDRRLTVRTAEWVAEDHA